MITDWTALSKALSDVKGLKENIESSTVDMVKLIECVSKEAAPVWVDACSGNANLKHGQVTQYDLAAYAVLGFLWGWRAARDEHERKEQEKWDNE